MAGEGEAAAPSSSAQKDDMLSEFLSTIGGDDKGPDDSQIDHVSRVLSSFKLDPFDVLDVPFDATVADIKKRYRVLSLRCHPDKSKHERADEAMSALAKAYKELLDDRIRDIKLRVVKAAREKVMKERKKQEKAGVALSTDVEADVKAQMHTLLANIEWKKRQIMKKQHEEEGRKAKEIEDLQKKRKLELEQEKQWEETRENRVASWRDFAHKGRVSSKMIKRPRSVDTSASAGKDKKDDPNSYKKNWK